MNTVFNRCRKYKFENLYGEWQVTLKLDGIRAMISKEGCYSRNFKALYNLDHLIKDEDQDVEVFMGSWEETVTAVRSQSYQLVKPEHIYCLNPIDSRLIVGILIDPTPEDVKNALEKANELGHEGIVLRQGDDWIKVKAIHTYDVKILDLKEGKGRHEGRLGAFITEMGKVGTGFDDYERDLYWNANVIGKIVEVECMELTPSGRFRFPRFVRIREDKS